MKLIAVQNQLEEANLKIFTPLEFQRLFGVKSNTSQKFLERNTRWISSFFLSADSGNSLLDYFGDHQAFYQEKEAEAILFKGGTALRLIYQSPRFSEDLDFSGFKISGFGWRR